MHNTPSRIDSYTLVLVELSLVVVLWVVVLVDIVPAKIMSAAIARKFTKKTHSGSKLVDWSQTRLAGIDLAKSSIDLNSSSERSTANHQYTIPPSLVKWGNLLLALASIRDGVTDLGKTQIPRLINQEMRMVAP
jgi:hypothetical protein